jgi:hypothetical protein
MTIVALLFLNGLLKYCNGDQDIVCAIGYGLLMTLSFFINIVTQNYQAFKGLQCGMQLRLGLNALILKKVILISKLSLFVIDFNGIRLVGLLVLF